MKNSKESREEILNKIKNMSDDELVDLYLKSIENQEQLAYVIEQLKLRNKSQFGSKSEKVSPDQLCLDIFNEVEYINDNKIEEDDDEKEDKTTSSKPRAKKKRLEDSNLPEVIEHHDIEDKTCKACGCELQELAPVVKKELVYIPGKYFIKKHIIHKYTCKKCNEENDDMVIVSGDDPVKRLVDDSIVTPSVVANIAVSKFVDGVPLYRQEADNFRKKIFISRQTMSNWLMKVDQVYLNFLVQLMLADLRKQDIIHMDETTHKIIEFMKEGRQNSYEWCACTGKYADKQIFLYFAKESRENKHARDIIGPDFKGYILSDGWDSYHKLDEEDENITNCGCWVHALRKLKEAAESYPSHEKFNKIKGKEEKELFLAEHPMYGNIWNMIAKIDKLFMLEKKITDNDLEAIRKIREEESSDIVNDIFDSSKKLDGDYPPKSHAGSAITYLLNEEKYLRNFLKDPRIELSNNRAERDLIKNFVLSRKNFLFSNTNSGAQTSSNYMSIIRTAMMNGLDPEKYLTWVLDEMKHINILTDEAIAPLLPYSPTIPQEVKAKGSNKDYRKK